MIMRLREAFQTLCPNCEELIGVPYVNAEKHRTEIVASTHITDEGVRFLMPPEEVECPHCKIVCKTVLANSDQESEGAY